MRIKRILLTRSSLVIVCVLCCIGILGVRLLISIFPVSISSPKFSSAQPLGEGEAIAFAYMRLDVLRPFELYILDDANELRPLSRGLMRTDISPVWSPDGEQIIYQSVSGGTTRYYIVDTAGENHREVTPDDRHKALLRWSPDGAHVAYMSYEQYSDSSIANSPYLCVTDVTTGDTHQRPAGNIQDLKWMPDGESIITIVRAEDSVALEAYDANVNHKRRISEADYLKDAATITLSPDASKVAYISTATDGDGVSATDTLNISALDGSAAKSFGALWSEGPIVWSPDSTRIAFVALTNDFEYALYVANADGTKVQELMLINEGDESGEIIPAAPAWSPDGTRIAISSFSSPEGPALYVMNADGTEHRQIITMVGSNGMIYDLAWRPRE